MKSARMLLLAVALVALGGAPGASAQVAPVLGQLMLYPSHRCPRGWAKADGQLALRSQNPALFAVYGATYGGDGVTTFALPDLRGRVAMHAGTGKDLPPAVQGQQLGAPTATMTVQTMPAHAHTLMASEALADAETPKDNALATFGSGPNIYADGAIGPIMVAVGVTGGGKPFDQHQPSLGMTYCVALQGSPP